MSCRHPAAASTPSTRRGAPPWSTLEAHGTVLVGVGHGPAPDHEPLTPHERDVVGVVTELRTNVDTRSITALARDGGEDLDCVREALEVLGELDPQLLVRVALNALVGAHVDGRGAARQSG